MAQASVTEVTKAEVSTYSDLQSADGHKYTVYNITVTDATDEAHVLQKRFNEFNEIYRALKANHPTVASFKFPSKTLNFNKDAADLKEMRRVRFNDFMKIVMEMKPTPPEVLAWLKSEGHKGASAHRDRLGAVTRAYKDRPPLIPALDEKGLIYEQMTKPTPMLKFGRSGAPHWRIFQLSADKTKIIWSSPTKRAGTSQVPVSEIKKVTNDQMSNNFKRMLVKRKDFKDLNSVSLSVIYVPAGKAQQVSLDVMCKHPEVLRVWLRGIDMLIEDARGAGKVTQVSSGSAAGAASGDGDDDDDEGDEGGDGDTNLITGECKAYTWGSGGWGQLGRASNKTPDSGSGAVESVVEADNQVGAVLVPLAKKKASATKANTAVDVRVASCGANSTAMLTRTEGPLLCGRSSVLCDAVGGSVREHVIIPAYANSGALGNAPVNGSGALSTSSALTVGVNVRQVACGEAHTLFLTFQGEVLASGSNFFGQLGDGSTVDHYSVKPVTSAWTSATCPRGALSVAAGFGCSACATLTASGDTDLYTWGSNDYGVLGQGSKEPEIVPQPTQVILGPDQKGPNMKITQLECGSFHMAALLELQGTVNLSSGAAICSEAHAMGSGASGASGGAAAAAAMPGGGGGGGVATGGGGDRTRLLTWGSGACGQLGHGSDVDVCIPTAIATLVGGKEVSSVSCGAAHTAAVLDVTSGGRRIKGQLWTWGNGAATTGQTNAAHSSVPKYFNFTKKGNQNNVAIQVSCGDHFTAVLDEDGHVWVVGVSPCEGASPLREPLELPKPPKDDDANGAKPNYTLDVEAIAAGGNHVCLVIANRTMV